MWNKEANSDDRRFLKDIDPIIALAEEGDLAHCHGIVGYFCQKVIDGLVPDSRVTIFVSNLLVRSQPPQRLKRWKRDRKIREALKREQENGMSLKPSRSDGDSATKAVSNRLIAEGHPVGESRVLTISYKGMHPILTLGENLECGKSPVLENLVAILPQAEDLYRKLLKPQNGKRSRDRLSLKNNRHPKLSKLIDKENIGEVDRLLSEDHSITNACKLITKGFEPGSWEQVRKTWHRWDKSKNINNLHRDNSGQKTVKPA